MANLVACQNTYIDFQRLTITKLTAVLPRQADGLGSDFPSPHRSRYSLHNSPDPEWLAAIPTEPWLFRWPSLIPRENNSLNRMCSEQLCICIGVVVSLSHRRMHHKFFYWPVHVLQWATEGRVSALFFLHRYGVKSPAMRRWMVGFNFLCGTRTKESLSV